MYASSYKITKIRVLPGKSGNPGEDGGFGEIVYYIIFCDIDLYFQPLYVVNDIRELKCLCTEDEQSRACWITALRIVKVSIITFSFSSPDL